MRFLLVNLVEVDDEILERLERLEEALEAVLELRDAVENVAQDDADLTDTDREKVDVDGLRFPGVDIGKSIDVLFPELSYPKYP